ncbi:Hypothetical predicted protein [Pelobates cultripes]|uniref:Uncharacterized protein n=1 Tax=Pelobates cultripes TaxID=61616 RepID=A0AAD1SZE6_PELCU|nr:Hypothetical predicted protein [Pelobates cultripes]
MADATRHLELHEEASTLHYRLEALFAAFWEKLERKLTLPAPQPGVTPSNLTRSNPQHKAPVIKVPARRRRQRAHRRRFRKAAATNLAAIHHQETQERGESRGREMGKQLQTQDPQQASTAPKKEAHTMWDCEFPVQGIGCPPC